MRYNRLSSSLLNVPYCTCSSPFKRTTKSPHLQCLFLLKLTVFYTSSPIPFPQHPVFRLHYPFNIRGLQSSPSLNISLYLSFDTTSPLVCNAMSKITLQENKDNINNLFKYGKAKRGRESGRV